MALKFSWMPSDFVYTCLTIISPSSSRFISAILSAGIDLQVISLRHAKQRRFASPAHKVVGVWPDHESSNRAKQASYHNGANCVRNVTSCWNKGFLSNFGQQISNLYSARDPCIQLQWQPPELQPGPQAGPRWHKDPNQTKRIERRSYLDSWLTA